MKPISIAKTAAAGCALLLFLGFGIGSVRIAPDHAIVLVDTTKNVYLAPSCVEMKSLPLYPLMTMGQAHKLKLRPDDGCRNGGGFTQEGRSLTGQLLQSVGLFPELKSRWNADGSWNW